MPVSECQPQPAALQHGAGIGGEVAEVGLAHGLGRQVRVEVDGHVERLRRRQDRLEPGVVEEAVLGGAVDERAVEAQLPHAPGHLLGGGVGLAHGQVRKAGEAVGMARDRLGQGVVGLAGQRHALRAVDEVGAGAGGRQHLHGDAGLIHRGEPPLADLGRQLQRVDATGQDGPGPEAAPGNGLAADVALHQRRDREMLFERDDAHGRCLQSGLADCGTTCRTGASGLARLARPPRAPFT